MHDYRKLKVWKRAHALVLGIYKVTERYPGTQLRGLISQSQRSAASIAANLVEGAGAQSDPEFRRFFGYAVSSSLELEYPLLLAHDLGYLDGATSVVMTSELGEIRGMLLGLRASLSK